MGLRSRRLGDQIRDILAQAFIGDRIGDSRLEGVSITHVRMSDDLQIAYVYFRLYRNDIDQKEVGVLLSEQFRGVLRQRVAKEVKMRRVPELKFFYDVSLDEGSHIEDLLKTVKKNG